MNFQPYHARPLHTDKCPQIRIYYGQKVHYLCTKATAPEARETMAEMSEVVQDMLERISVDLTEDSVAKSLRVFDVTSLCWISREDDVLALLREATSALCAVLGLSKNVARDFEKAAIRLAKVVQAAKGRKLKVNNRQAWSWTLLAEWRAKYMSPPFQFREFGGFEDFVTFYLSLKINTTTLERNLGVLVRQLHAHCGSQAPDGALLSSILHVVLNGPKERTGVAAFDRCGDSGILSPTPFTRACGRLWLECYGRRFQKKYGKGPQKRPLPTGTFESVKRGRIQATQAISRAAVAGESSQPSLIDGLSLPSNFAARPAESRHLAGTRWSATPRAAEGSKSKKTPAMLFREHTERKLISDLVVRIEC